MALGAQRPVAALQVLYDQDMTWTLALGNTSGGPWVTVDTHGCAPCTPNIFSFQGIVATTALPATVAASHARMTITWSTAGGIGGCDDLCDFATNLYALRVFGPGALPPAAQSAAEAAAPPPPPCISDPRVLITSSEAAVLTGDAALSTAGSGYDGRSRSTQLTAANLPGSSGAAEFAVIVRPAVDCPCIEDGVLLTFYVWLGAGVMPGEGVVLSLVDASRQTPGKTVYMRGCGVTAALPANAISVVLDTASSDPECDAPGAGVRLVSTLMGADAPPLVLASTLEQGTASFRQAAWVPVQLSVTTATIRSGVGFTAQAQSLFVPRYVFVNGSNVLTSLGVVGLHAAELRAVNATLEALYVVVSARTGTAGGDAQAVSGVRVECGVGFGSAAAHASIINWDGLRQPFSPPQQQQQSALTAAHHDHATRNVHGVEAFGITLVGALAAFTAAAAARHCWRWGLRVSQGTPDVELAALLEEAVAAEDAPAVVLSCSADDALLADALHAKLRLADLPVFVATLAAAETSAAVAAALDAGVLHALRAAPVFAPLVTLPLLRRIVRAAAAGQADAVLASWLAALQRRDDAGAADARPVLIIRPLLVGSMLADAMQPQWGNLQLEPEYTRLLALLPDTVPAPSVAALEAALQRAGAPPLSPRLAALTVREIVVGAGDNSSAGGILGASSASFALACSQQDLGLYLRDRYVRALREDLRAAAAAVDRRGAGNV